MDISTDFESIIKFLNEKFPDREIDVMDELENSINIFRSLKQDETIITFTDYEKNWIKRCSVELLERSVDTRNLASYSENGYSVSYFESLISSDLKKEIFPKARAIK